MMTGAKQRIDINCDVGESDSTGNDAALFPYITSCSIACGVHAADPLQIQRTIRLAMQFGLRIGAHPSYPDRPGFGRRPMQIADSELRATLDYQVAALLGMTRVSGGHMAYVKPHGALYNTAADDASVAQVIAACIAAFDKHIALMGLAGSAMADAAQQEGIRFIPEAFADRRYDDRGRLVPRSDARAMIAHPIEAAEQVRAIAEHGMVRSISGKMIPVKAESICVHGDHPGALDILRAIHNASGS